VRITTGGTYWFCSISDDGSMVYVQNQHIVNNDGLHGDVERCGSINLAPGEVAVRVEGFQAGGGATQVLTYR
jgi:hypothetical protein